MDINGGTSFSGAIICHSHFVVVGMDAIALKVFWGVWIS